MALKFTQEDIDRVQNRYGAAFEQLKRCNSQQIGDILVKAHNSGLLAICGALFDEKDVDELYVALMIGIKMLKINDLTLPEEYLNDDKDEDMQYDLNKPNSHLNDPIFPGLTWTARDFALLGDYLSNKLVSYIEDRDCESDAMERLLDMKDECSKVFANSEFFKEHQNRLAQRKREREEGMS